MAADVDEFDDGLRKVAENFPAAVRGILLRVLTMPDDDRARAIGEIYPDGRMPGLAELLMDLEADPAMRLTVERELRGLPEPELVPALRPRQVNQLRAEAAAVLFAAAVIARHGRRLARSWNGEPRASGRSRPARE